MLSERKNEAENLVNESCYLTSAKTAFSTVPITEVASNRGFTENLPSEFWNLSEITDVSSSQI
jgi:hypothetical protein